MDTMSEQLKIFSKQILADTYSLEYDICCMNGACDVDREETIDNIKIAGEPLSIRRALQIIGTEWCRNLIDPNIWTRVVRKKIESENPERLLISDVRFQHEGIYLQKKLRKLGYSVKVINLVRPSTTSILHR